jgi:ribulose-5-phosphate 4-epimerase/fuculose-1-phosphate aldolase
MSTSIVKFKVEFVSTSPPHDNRIADLQNWCDCFNQIGLTPRLGNTGRSLGNLSFRLEPGLASFIITGSGLESKDMLSCVDFVKVLEADPDRMWVVAEGTKDPSSESMMHYTIYKKRSDIGAIFHGHDKEIVRNADRLTLPVTSHEELPGTVELLHEVDKILNNEMFVVMKNHGFLSFGKTMDEAGKLALKMKSKLSEIK